MIRLVAVRQVLKALQRHESKTTCCKCCNQGQETCVREGFGFKEGMGLDRTMARGVTVGRHSRERDKRECASGTRSFRLHRSRNWDPMLA